VGSIIPGDLPGRWRGSTKVGELAGSAAIPADLIQATDDHTRALLQRRPTSRRGQLVPRALVVADVLGLTLAYLLATRHWGGQGLLGSRRELILFACSLPCWVVVARLHGLYRRDEERTDHCTTDDIVGVFHLVTIAAWLLLVASRLAGWNGPGIFNLAAFWLLAVCVVPMARTVARLLCKRSQAYEQNTVIVGAGDVGQLVARKLIKHPEYGANVVGFVDRFPKARRADLPERLSILGGPERLPEIIKCLDVEKVVITSSDDSISAPLSLLHQLRPYGVQIDLVPSMFELIGPRVSIHSVEGLPLIGLPPTHRAATSRALKRAMDLVGASVALAVLAPVMAYIALRVSRDSPGPVLFRQTRLGTGMKEFTALKFRTMKVDTDSEAHREYIRRTMTSANGAADNGIYKLNQGSAVTKVGAWLRKTSLDEIPQLINVIRGDMSLVGPRPCIPYETENFEPHHLERFLMPQGITGLWQVTARANSTYREALDLDVAYVRDWSLGLDLRLLLRTPLQVLRQRVSTA
jgi:exopolysaccharide biosynthesis polyprenyl glycosylphosphotransferase